MKKTVLFGNGLGMAIDPLHFSLTMAMHKIWKSSHILSATHRELISACLPVARPNGPESEADLEILQEVTAACQLLKNVETPHYHWLSPHGASFPESVTAFTGLVAREICEFSRVSSDLIETWESFISALQKLCDNEHPHIMTLNYDDLLYPIIQQTNLNYTIYKDGFVNGRFSSTNLFRTPKEKYCAFYLKLHGSPQIYTARDSTIRRVPRNAKSSSENLRSGHLILSHVSKKESLIERSPILSVYWDMLRVALRESGEILLFGYSGNDRHLNQQISNFPNLKRRIIEWVGSGNHKVRVDFWKNELGGEIDYIPLENILDFNEW